MDDLTLEQAERCARACGYEETTRPVPNPFNPTKECWVLPKTDVIDSPLPIAAYFWFPRLWEALKGTLKHQGTAIGVNQDRDLAGDCMVLVELIEAYKEANGG